MIQRYYHDVLIGFEAIKTNKLKSFLTALGIIFGVAAVISMFAIGNGARKEILDQIKEVGVNNIVVEAVVDEEGSEDSPGSKTEGGDNSSKEKGPEKFSKGLNLLDAQAIAGLPTVARVSPQISLKTQAISGDRQISVSLEGVTNSYFEMFNLTLSKGDVFQSAHLENGLPVCILGSEVKRKLFGYREALGQRLKCGNEWLLVVGIFEARNPNAGQNASPTRLTQIDDRVFVPVQTVLLRYRNRALLNSRIDQRQANRDDDNPPPVDRNFHQLDRIVVQVRETALLPATSEILDRMLKRRHYLVPDYRITVPELLLKQQQRTKDIFNIVLGAIASISLVVGGIGIMNIMLASVLERTREIGTRRAIGATRRDIIYQFLSESVMISLSGGLTGIILGIVLAHLITHFSGILTIVSPFSVLVAFGVSALVGIGFGLIPARKAAEKDPVEAIRYE